MSAQFKFESHVDKTITQNQNKVKVTDLISRMNEYQLMRKLEKVFD